MATLKARYKQLESVQGTVEASSMTAVYLLEATNALDAWSYVAYGAGHPDLGSYVCKTKSVQMAPEAKGDLWVLTCTHEPVDVKKSDATTRQDPPPTDPNSTDTWSRNIDVAAVPYTADAYKDVNGLKIANTAGVYFTPTPQRTIYDTVITFRWRVFAFPSALLEKIGDVQNVDADKAFCGKTFSFLNKKALLKDLRITSLREDGKNFWDVSAVVERKKVDHYNPMAIPNVGKYELDGSNLVPILDANGMPTQTDMPLGEDGTSTGTEENVEFQMYPESDFITDIPGDPTP